MNKSTHFLQQAPVFHKEKLPEELANGLIQSSNKENIPLFLLIGVFEAYFRYLSNVLQVYSGYDELLFWKSVSAVIFEYQKENPELNPKFEKYNLFIPEFKRFYINRLRLHQGYEERSGFATPKKGGNLANPLLSIKQEVLESKNKTVDFNLVKQSE
jgi:siderophore synthetase component